MTMYEQDLVELSEYSSGSMRGWTHLATVLSGDGATVLGRLRMVGHGDGVTDFDFVTEFEEAVASL